jgi:hypothetical protein
MLDTRTARIVRTWTLDMQAVGWPAAIAEAGGRLFIAGQPQSGTGAAARLEALTIGKNGALRLLWRTQLGLTHAGIWLGPVGPHALAGYLPDAHDFHGWITVWDSRNASLRVAFAATAPVLAADAGLNRLYLNTAGRMESISAATGAASGRQSGSPPFAVDESRGLVAYSRSNRVVVASARSLLPLGSVSLPAARSLGADADGAELLVGTPTGLARVDLGVCRSH